MKNRIANNNFRPSSFLSRGHTATMTAVALCTMALISCGTKSEAEEAPASTTPVETVESFLTAVMENDADKAIALTAEGADNEKIVRTFTRFASTTKGFHDALVEKYGEEAAAGMEMETITAKDLEEVRNAEVEIDNGKAIVYPPEEQENPIHLIETDEGWRIQVDTIFGDIPAEEIDQALKLFGSMADLVEQFTTRIKEEDLTIEEVEEQFGQAMMGMMMGLMEE